MQITENYDKDIAEIAFHVLRDAFDPRQSRRFVSGVCVSSPRPNANGWSFLASGLKTTTPVPLLIDHRWERPIGRVTHLRAHGEQVVFQAEVANSDHLEWAWSAWLDLRIQCMTALSIRAR